MADFDPALLTIAEASRKINTGDLTPSGLIEACLQRTRSHEPDVRAWSYLNDDQTSMQARLLDSEKATSPLYGIPFGVKDIIDTADMPTELGTPVFKGNQPARDAASVALLKESGAVCMGKTVTTELAHFHPGKTRNPHSLTHTPGGSSSGSAAAVAACMVPFALGTQTTGSVLRPASYCGVYGFKPSHGDVNRSGVFECAASFDTVGWFTRSVGDIEIVRQALIGAPHSPLKTVKLSELRIGLFRGPDWEKADPATQSSIESAATHLGSIARLQTIDAPDGFDNIARHHRRIAGYEFARAISWERTQRGHLLSPKLLQGRCEDGLQCTYEEYAEAQKALAALRIAMGETMQAFDMLLTPVATGEAWSGLQATGDPVFNTAWTALHMPAVSVPAFRGESGLPVGMQLIGGFRQDANLLAGTEAVRTELAIETIRAPT